MFLSTFHGQYLDPTIINPLQSIMIMLEVWPYISKIVRVIKLHTYSQHRWQIILVQMTLSHYNRTLLEIMEGRM